MGLDFYFMSSGDYNNKRNDYLNGIYHTEVHDYKHHDGTYIDQGLCSYPADIPTRPPKPEGIQKALAFTRVEYDLAEGVTGTVRV